VSVIFLFSRYSDQWKNAMAAAKKKAEIKLLEINYSSKCSKKSTKIVFNPF
jgi:hypothetical protein